MSWKNTPARYGSVTIGLHWLALVVPITVSACTNLTALYPKGSEPREALNTWRVMLGPTVLLLLVLSLVNRLAGGSPVVGPPLPLGQRRLASAIHLALYALMLAMPVLGWLLLSAAGKPVPFGAHALAALRHQGVTRDDTLPRMLPGKA